MGRVNRRLFGNLRRPPRADTWALAAVVAGALAIGSGCAQLQPQPPAERVAEPSALDTYLATAEQLERRGQLHEAALVYERARTLDPTAIDYARRLATLYDRQNLADHARREYQRAVERSPGDADLWNDFGYFCYRRGGFAEAEPKFARALAIDPRHERAAVNRALSLAQLGQDDAAHEQFASVVGPAAAHHNLGVVLARQGRFDEARTAFHRALQADPRLEQPRVFLSYLDSSRID